MWNRLVVRWLSVVAVFLTCASELPAQFLEPPREEKWARDMVGEANLNINYKSVARGQDVAFRVKLTNLYEQEIHVTALATSCGCISWDENKGGALAAPIVIPSGKEAYITLRLDTVRHHGEQKNKKATITLVNAASGKPGTATLLVEGYIRTDVVLQPGSVNFGSVDPEKGAEQRVAVNYAGRNDWKILSARNNSPHITTDVVEKSRGNGLVNYELIVKLKPNLPIGQIRDQLVLVTDDANNPQIPVQIDGKIEPEYFVADANFGDVYPGKPKKIPVFVRYTKLPAKPFKIEKFERTRQEATIKVEKSADAKPFHVFSLTFTPPDQPGEFAEDFYLTISGRTEPIIFKARATIKKAPVDSGSKP